MNVVFPNGSKSDFDTDAVLFPIEIDHERAIGKISREALMDHFNAGQDLVAAFEANRQRIEEVTLRKIKGGARGTIVLYSRDF